MVNTSIKLSKNSHKTQTISPRHWNLYFHIAFMSNNFCFVSIFFVPHTLIILFWTNVSVKYRIKKHFYLVRFRYINIERKLFKYLILITYAQGSFHKQQQRKMKQTVSSYDVIWSLFLSLLIAGTISIRTIYMSRKWVRRQSKTFAFV